MGAKRPAAVCPEVDAKRVASDKVVIRPGATLDDLRKACNELVLNLLASPEADPYYQVLKLRLFAARNNIVGDVEKQEFGHESERVESKNAIVQEEVENHKEF